jgi:hypothetical protein
MFRDFHSVMASKSELSNLSGPKPVAAAENDQLKNVKFSPSTRVEPKQQENLPESFQSEEPKTQQVNDKSVKTPAISDKKEQEKPDRDVEQDGSDFNPFTSRKVEFPTR